MTPRADRRTSIGGDIREDGSRENRSYFGKTSTIGNERDLVSLERAVAAARKAERRTGKKIPVIAAVKAKTAFVPAEFEKKVDAILVGYSVDDKVLIDIATGRHNPRGRLPVTNPKDMDAVEAQLEDVGEDMTPYRGFGGERLRVRLRAPLAGSDRGQALTQPAQTTSGRAGPLEL